MRISSVVGMVLLASACASATPLQEETVPLRDVPMPPVEARFPVSHDAAAIEKAYAAPAGADGENVSVEGEVVSVRKLKNVLPAITLRLSPTVDIVLLHSTRMEQDDFLEPGMHLRAMGYLRKTQDMVALLGNEAGSSNPLSIMSLCLVKTEPYVGVFDQKYLQLCAAWQKGKRLERLK